MTGKNTRVTGASLLADEAERARAALIANMIRGGSTLATIRVFIARGWPDVEPLSAELFDQLREALLERR